MFRKSRGKAPCRARRRSAILCSVSRCNARVHPRRRWKMPDEVSLREKAREAIRSGKLPARKPSRMFGGTGSEKPCALCGDIVPRDQPELEMELTRDGSAPEAHHY